MAFASVAALHTLTPAPSRREPRPAAARAVLVDRPLVSLRPPPPVGQIPLAGGFAAAVGRAAVACVAVEGSRRRADKPVGLARAVAEVVGVAVAAEQKRVAKLAEGAVVRARSPVCGVNQLPRLLEPPKEVVLLVSEPRLTSRDRQVDGRARRPSPIGGR